MLRSVAEKVPQPGPHPPTYGPRELSPSGGVGFPKVRPGGEAPLCLPDGQAPGVEGGGQALGRCQGFPGERENWPEEASGIPKAVTLLLGI